MNSKSTYTLIFLLSFMTTMETQGYALHQTSSSVDFVKVHVDQDKEETKKALQSTRALVIKKAYAQAALVKANIIFLTTRQYQQILVAHGYDLHSTGTSKNTVKIVCVHSKHSSLHSDFIATA